MISVQNLNFSYPCGRQILRDISFSAQSGDFVAVLGSNGAGKSTLLKCFDHILRPQSGSVLVDGTDLLSLSLSELARQVAFVAQGAGGTRLSVYDTLLLGRKPYIKWGVSQRDRHGILPVGSHQEQQQADQCQLQPQGMGAEGDDIGGHQKPQAGPWVKDAPLHLRQGLPFQSACGTWPGR